MDKVFDIKEIYFTEGKSVVEVAAEMGVTKQYVSKVLKNSFPQEYLKEKEKRKSKNRKKRNEKKCENIKIKRQMMSAGDVTAHDLRKQHESDVKGMSEGARLTSKSLVYCNLNAYNVVRNCLVYNVKAGARPIDLPNRFSLKVNF